MNTYGKSLVLAILVAAIGLQTGCDQHEAATLSESHAVLGKGSTLDGLGARLAADSDFRALRKLLHDGDQRARLRYVVGANLKRDMAFAKAAQRKGALSASDKSRLAEIRGLSLADAERIAELRSSVLARFPELESLSKQQLHDVLLGAGVGGRQVAGKTMDKCDDCNYAYNACLTNAQVIHSIELVACALLVETVFGATVCYLTSVTKYMWTVSSCRRIHQYCRSNNGCVRPAMGDTA